MWLLLSTMALAVTWTVGPDGDVGTVAEAVAQASSGDVVSIGAGVFPTRVDVGKALVFRGSGKGVTVLEAGGKGSAIVVQGGADVRIEDLTLASSGTAHALEVDAASCELERVVLRTNPDDSGPTSVVRLVFARAHWVDVELDGTGAMPVRGGLVEAIDSDIVCEACTFENGHSSRQGGAVALNGSSGTFIRSQFSDNVSEWGGAIDAEGASTAALTLDSCTFERNVAVVMPGPGGARGGAVRAFGTHVDIRDSTFLSNESEILGGALSLTWVSDASITGTRFEETQAEDGGAVAAENLVRLELRSNTFVGTTAGQSGGALTVTGGMDVDVRGNRFCRTSAESGGVMTVASTSLRLRNNVISGSQGFEGPSIANLVEDSQLEVENNTVFGAAGRSFLVWVDANSSATLVNNTLAQNNGSMVGGDGSVVVSHNLYWENDAAPSDLDTHVTSDPRFLGSTDCSGTFRTDTNSPAIDQGSPDLFDVDGTRSDIGAYGGPGAIAWDLDDDGASEEDDCAPLDPTRQAPLPEVVGDGVDQDCDGTDLCFVDEDGDGIGGAGLALGSCIEPGLASVTGDCDDADPERVSTCDVPPAWFCGNAPVRPSVLWLGALVLVGRRRRSTRRPALQTSR